MESYSGGSKANLCRTFFGLANLVFALKFMFMFDLILCGWPRNLDSERGYYATIMLPSDYSYYIVTVFF